MMNRNHRTWPQQNLMNPNFDQSLIMMNRNHRTWPEQNLMNPNFDLTNQPNRKGKMKIPDHPKSGGVGYNKRRKFCPKKKMNKLFTRSAAPYAPKNTTSFIIRAKKAGGIASLVSPCPATPAVLSTPVLTPSTEFIGDMAKEKWGIDGYGTMNGLIRLRDEAEEEVEVEEHVKMKRRLDHDLLNRFEMIYPNSIGVVELDDDDLDDHENAHIILQAEEANSTLKEKLFLLGREMADLKKRLLRLERRNQGLEVMDT